MRILICLVALIPAPAWGEWVRVSENPMLATYIDPATIRKIGDLVQVMQLQDLRQRHADGEMSRQSLQEYDCKGRRSRGLTVSAHSESMARGKTLGSDSKPGQWISIPSWYTNAGNNVLKIVCAK